MNYKSRSYRIDDEVAEAIQKLPMSLNQFLRKVLSADGVFDSETPAGEPKKSNLVAMTVPSAYDLMPKVGYDNDGRGWVRREGKRRELRPKGDNKR